jgi:phage tail protein X
VQGTTAVTPGGEAAPGARYTVRPGDTLWSIASRQLGDPSRLPELIEANRHVHPGLATSPDFLRPGWTLVLPGNPAPTSRPDLPATGKPVAVGRPLSPPTVPPQVAPPRPLGGPGFDPTQGFVVERQETHVEAVETETETRWEVGPDGKARPTRQETDVTAAETVTRTRWRALGAQPVPPEAASDPGNAPAVIAPPMEMPPASFAPRPEMPVAEPPVQHRPPAERPVPTVDEAKHQRLRRELDDYLAEHTDSAAVVSLVENHSEYLEAATVLQQARLVRLALGGLFTDRKDRDAALKVLKVANASDALPGVMNQLSEQKKLGSAIRTLSGSDQGREVAQLFVSAGLYGNSGIVQAMDGDAVSDMLRTLGWRHPMIGTNDTLLALPDGHKRVMIEKLLDGEFTLQEHRQAAWLNQHMTQPVKLPAYDPHRGR